MTTTDPTEAERAIRDTYGYVVTGKPRHRKCRCPVPCEKRFRCRSARHVGKRATPWCNGDGASCALCWLRRELIKERKAAKRPAKKRARR